MITVQEFDQLFRLTVLALEAARAGRRDDGEELLRQGLARLYSERPEARELIQRWETTLAAFREQFPPERGRRGMRMHSPSTAIC